MRKGLMWLVLLSVGVSAQSIPEQTGYWVGTLGALLFRLGGSLEDIGADPVKFVIAVKIALLVIGWFVIYPSRFPTPLKYSALALLLFTLVSVQAQFILTATGILRILVQSGFLVLAIIASYRAVKFVRGRSRPVQIGVLGGLLFMLYQLYSLWAPKLSGTVAMAYWLALVVGAIGLAILLFFAVSKFLPASIAGPASSVERDIITRLRKRTLRKNIEKKAKKSLADASKGASDAVKSAQEKADAIAAQTGQLSAPSADPAFAQQIQAVLKDDPGVALSFFITNHSRMDAQSKVSALSRVSAYVGELMRLRQSSGNQIGAVDDAFNKSRSTFEYAFQFMGALVEEVDAIGEEIARCQDLKTKVVGAPFSEGERAQILAELEKSEGDLRAVKRAIEISHDEVKAAGKELLSAKDERKQLKVLHNQMIGLPLEGSKQFIEKAVELSRYGQDVSTMIDGLKSTTGMIFNFLELAREFSAVFKKMLDELSERRTAFIDARSKAVTSKTHSGTFERVGDFLVQVGERCDYMKAFDALRKNKGRLEQTVKDAQEGIDRAVSGIKKRAQSVLSSSSQLMETVFVSPEQASSLLLSVNSLVDFYGFIPSQLAFIESKVKSARETLQKIVALKASLKGEDLSQTQSQLSRLDARERQIREKLVHLISEAPEAKRHAELLSSLLAQLASQDVTVKHAAQQKFAAEGQQLLQFVKSCLAEISQIASQSF